MINSINEIYNKFGIFKDECSFEEIGDLVVIDVDKNDVENIRNHWYKGFLKSKGNKSPKEREFWGFVGQCIFGQYLFSENLPHYIDDDYYPVGQGDLYDHFFTGINKPSPYSGSGSKPCPQSNPGLILDAKFREPTPSWQLDPGIGKKVGDSGKFSTPKFFIDDRTLAKTPWGFVFGQFIMVNGEYKAVVAGWQTSSEIKRLIQIGQIAKVPDKNYYDVLIKHLRNIEDLKVALHLYRLHGNTPTLNNSAPVNFSGVSYFANKPVLTNNIIPQALTINTAINTSPVIAVGSAQTEDDFFS